MRSRFRRWAGTRRIVAETTAMVVLIVGIKLLVHALSVEPITLSPLYTSIVAGAVFVMGLIVAGELADYKESDRMPAEITASLDTLLEDARMAKLTYPEFDLAALRQRLCAVTRTLRRDLTATDDRSALTAINDLSVSISELERLGIPANYVVRLRTEQSSIRKNVLRIYHIQREEFLPSAYALVESIVALIIGGLLFTKIQPTHDAITLLALISYFLIFMVRLLRILDKPFQPSTGSHDDVSLFLLREFRARVEDDPPAVPGA